MAGSQASRGKGPLTRGGQTTRGGKSSGGRGNGKSGQSEPIQPRRKGKAVDGGGSSRQPSGETESSGGGGSGGGGSGRGGAVGKGPAPEYIPLGELAAIAAARSSKSRGKRPTGTSEPVVRRETTSEPLVRPNPGASSHDSNPSGGRQLSPPSQLTPQSANNSASRNTLVPLQYPPQRLHVQNEVEEEEDEEEAEIEDEEEAHHDLVHEDEAVEDLEPNQNDAENEDYEQLLDQILANPGRLSLPILSEHPVPNRDDSYWLVFFLCKLVHWFITRKLEFT